MRPVVRDTKLESRRIRALVEAVGLKPIDIARETGIAPASLSHYMTCTRPITIEAAMTLSKVYGVPLDWIFFGDPSGLPMRYSALRKVS